MTANPCAELWKNLASRASTSGSISAILGEIGSKSYPMTTSSSPRQLTCSRVWGPAISKRLLTLSKSSRKKAWPRKREVKIPKIRTSVVELQFAKEVRVSDQSCSRKRESRTPTVSPPFAKGETKRGQIPVALASALG